LRRRGSLHYWSYMPSKLLSSSSLPMAYMVFIID
jgi:hypothetical protein